VNRRGQADAGRARGGARVPARLDEQSWREVILTVYPRTGAVSASGNAGRARLLQATLSVHPNPPSARPAACLASVRPASLPVSGGEVVPRAQGARAVRAQHPLEVRGQRLTGHDGLRRAVTERIQVI
jgi:hypothetical protein